MSEKCELCGGDIVRETNEGGEWARCVNSKDECLLANNWWDASEVDRLQSALALLKRVESGESVEIRKRDGEWPEIREVKGAWSFSAFPDGEWSQAIATTFPEAAAAWNGGGE